MRILSIGDIHGRDTWKFDTHGSPYEYTTWRTAVDHGAPADSDFWSEMPYMAFDRIVFVGDYVDSFTIGNAEMKQNLADIIHFKKVMGDRVVLLLGNHDVQYIVPNQICSGYRGEMQHDFYKIFTDDLDLFQAAFQVGNTLWTHAGVTGGWLKHLKERMTDPEWRHSSLVEERNPVTVAEWLNLAWEVRVSDLFLVDRYSGGTAKWAGPFWVRPNVLNQHPLPGINQIVGHTPQAAVWEVDVDDNTKHYFIDCLEHGNEECLELEL